MLRSVRGVAAVVLAVGLAGLIPSVARADGYGDTKCPKDKPKPGCTVSAGTSGQSGNTQTGNNGRAGDGKCRNPQGQEIPCERDGGWAGSDGCYYKPVDLSAGTIAALGGQPSGTGAWYQRVCYGTDGTATTALGGPVWLNTPPAVSPEILARQARSMLTLPDVVIRVNPAGDQLVRLPTWLALDPASWRAQSATASVPGVAVTATARPVKATWAMGDRVGGQPPGVVVCTGPGTPWRAGMDPAAASPDCGYRYLRSSAGASGAAFTVTVTVAWEVTWAGAGQSGTIPGLTTTGSVRVRVAESQAVITA